MLKEEDPMIELIREWIIHPLDFSAGIHLSVLEVLKIFQDMIAEHVDNPTDSSLRKMLPKINRMFLPLDLVKAAQAYDTRKHLLARKRVPPTFKEVRHILNLATVDAIATKLKLVTFDADDTIYEDGGTISATSGMVKVIVELLRRGIVVSLVTAAGYPGNPGRYEERLRGILDALAKCTNEERARFLVMGGECNYLLETYTTNGTVFLREIEGAKWKDGRGVRWHEHDITDLLDLAEKSLHELIKVLHMEAMVLRKERAVGIVNTTTKRYNYEDLEEICLTLQHELKHCKVPFCAFNGGNDVWVDIGNKALGIQALQKYVFRFLPKHLQDHELSKIQGMECLHVGDRFTRTGNDTRSRDAATTVWVSDPSETMYIMNTLLKAIDTQRSDLVRRQSEPPSLSEVEMEAEIEAAILAATEESMQKKETKLNVLATA